MEEPGVLDSFWGYEAALMANDLQALDNYFQDSPDTTRGDERGLLRGHDAIGGFRTARGGAPRRRIVSVDVRTIGDTHALVTAVTAPERGGRGLQTQLWRQLASGWVIEAAHVSAPPTTFDSSVWRVVGDPLLAGGHGLLAGETLAIKDLFAVAGQRTGAGVPAFLAESAVASVHATAVQRLLDAGAGIRGVTQTDQFAYSLAGDNGHYGTPPNAVVAGGLPGGSTSGSSTAVALGAATIGLGTDTAGSIRIPASYQGLWGLRTTHGSVPTTGLVALAPDFDTVGLLTRTGELLGRAARALLGEQGRAEPPPRLISSPELIAGLPEPVRGAFSSWLTCADDVTSAPLPAVTPDIADAFRIHQARQAWEVHGQWLSEHPDALIGAAAGRFATASLITAAEDVDAISTLSQYRSELTAALGGRIFVVPSAASTAPRVWESPATVDLLRAATIGLTCMAAILGRPVVSVPCLTVGGDPVGVSLIGPPDSDLQLINLGRELAEPQGS